MRDATLLSSPVQRGFVLVATLWLLAALTLAAGFFALWVERAVRTATEQQDAVQGDLDMQSTQATVLYLLSTQYYTFAGLTVPGPPATPLTESELLAQLSDPNYDPMAQDEHDATPLGTEILLNDQVYLGQGHARFALQDERGLLGLNLYNRDYLWRLLGLLGVADDQRDPLLSKFEDFLDFDDLYRLNGAENQAYRERGLPPPLNRMLRSTQEVRQVLDWEEQTGIWQDERWGQVTTTALFNGAPIPNVNTAPLLVLEAMGIAPELALRLVEARRSLPVRSMQELTQVLGLDLGIDEMDAFFFASSSLRLTLWYNGAQRMRQLHLVMTPHADQAKPWAVDYALELPLLESYKSPPAHAQTTLLDPTLPTTPK